MGGHTVDNGCNGEIQEKTQDRGENRPQENLHGQLDILAADLFGFDLARLRHAATTLSFA